MCHDKFGLRNCELFDPFDLFDVRDFGKVRQKNLCSRFLLRHKLCTPQCTVFTKKTLSERKHNYVSDNHSELCHITHVTRGILMIRSGLTRLTVSAVDSSKLCLAKIREVFSVNIVVIYCLWVCIPAQLDLIKLKCVWVLKCSGEPGI